MRYTKSNSDLTTPDEVSFSEDEPRPMCGIAGIVTTTGVDHRDAVRAMADRLTHRGPDDRSDWTHPSAFLAHTRLAIIDLQTGRQPFLSEDGRIAAIYNGEIYNFNELKAELTARGHRFNTNTDGEVIVHLYQDDGPSFLSRLRGMFALALYDADTGELLLARDRLGQKPLVYLKTPDTIAFASELTALRQSRLIPFHTNPHALDDYLTYGYVPAPQTIYAGVSKLPPGHALIWRDGSSRLFHYWSPTDERPDDRMTEAHAEEALRSTLTDAVRLRLASDVPLGAFLSGGLDSSIIVALMASLADRAVKTYAIGFGEPEYSELAFAREVADMHNTDHTEFVVRPDCLSVLPQLVERFGEPFADSSAVPTYYVANRTAEHVKVALSGDGGDELFSGYERYEALRAAGRFHGSAILRYLFGRRFWANLGRAADTKNSAVSLRRFALSVAMNDLPRYLSYLRIFSPEQKSALYRPDFIDRLGGHDAQNYLHDVWERFADTGRPGKLDLSARAARTDLLSYLPGDLLTKVDITSMTNSLEVRSPFLDHELVSLALRTPARLKRTGLRGKRILRRTFADLVPPPVLHRRKMGFALPISRWLRGELSDFLRTTLLADDACVRQYLRPEALKDLVTEHIDQRADHAARLWALLMLELWKKGVRNLF